MATMYKKGNLEIITTSSFEIETEVGSNEMRNAKGVLINQAFDHNPHLGNSYFIETPTAEEAKKLGKLLVDEAKAGGNIWDAVPEGYKVDEL